MPDGRSSEGIDGVGQAEGHRHLAEAEIYGEAVEIAHQDVGVPHLKLNALKVRIGARTEALLGIVENLRVPRNPVAKRSRESELCRMDRRLRNLVAHLVPRCRMAHQIAELVGPVAGLVVGDPGDRAMHAHAVRVEGSISSELQDQARLAVDVGGRVEKFIPDT